MSGFPPQKQEKQPGLQHKMGPQPAVADDYKAAGKLKGKKLFITGGDSGIGRSVVVMAAMEGVDGITMIYREHEKKDAEDTAKLAEKHGARVNFEAGDVADTEFAKNAIENHIKEFGAIDILINNASEQHICDSLDEIDLEQVKRTFKSNGNYSICSHLTTSHSHICVIYSFRYVCYYQICFESHEIW